MSWLVDPTQRILEQALDGLSQRNALIASNLANIDTPGYQPQSIDFESTLRAELGDQATGVANGTSGASMAAGTVAGAGLQVAALASGGAMNPPSFGPSASVGLLQTDPRHLAGSAPATGTAVASPTPFAGSLRNDGNQVDLESEMTALVQNQLRFSAVSRLASGRLGLVNDVLTGGR